jgi:hypothetical protein
MWVLFGFSILFYIFYPYWRINFFLIASNKLKKEKLWLLKKHM